MKTETEKQQLKLEGEQREKNIYALAKRVGQKVALLHHINTGLERVKKQPYKSGIFYSWAHNTKKLPFRALIGYIFSDIYENDWEKYTDIKIGTVSHECKRKGLEVIEEMLIKKMKGL